MQCAADRMRKRHEAEVMEQLRKDYHSSYEASCREKAKENERLEATLQHLEAEKGNLEASLQVIHVGMYIYIRRARINMVYLQVRRYSRIRRARS